MNRKKATNMKITKNDVGRFAVTRGGAIVPIECILEYVDRFPVLAGGRQFQDNGRYFYNKESDLDLIQWADEHPKYKAVFTWPVTE